MKPRDNHSQARRLAGYAARDADRLRDALPEVAALLDRVHELNRDPEAPNPNARPDVAVKDLSAITRPKDHAEAINAMLDAYERFGDEAYLDAARAYARRAYAVFCDDRSPLPRAVAKGVDLRTGAGEPFIDLYWKGAGLMRAFARLGAATR
ncbi:MAG: hypothetical protein ACYTGQ_08430 [Planctomycetota bacterium]